MRFHLTDIEICALKRCVRAAIHENRYRETPAPRTGNQVLSAILEKLSVGDPQARIDRDIPASVSGLRVAGGLVRIADPGATIKEIAK